MTPVFGALARNAAAGPDRVAFTCGDDRATRAGFHARVLGLLASARTGAHPVIGVALAPGVAYPVADPAVTLTGRRLVPLPHFFSPAQIAHIIVDAGVKAVSGGIGCGARTISPNATAPGAGHRVSGRGGAGDLNLRPRRPAKGRGAGGSADRGARADFPQPSRRPRRTAICRSCRNRSFWSRFAASSRRSSQGPT
jgi:hypothetical protein